MTTKQKVGCLTAIVSIFITQPIWLYLLYQILKLVNATDIMWFLFWIYVPAIFIVAAIKVMIDSIFDEN